MQRNDRPKDGSSIDDERREESPLGPNYKYYIVDVVRSVPFIFCTLYEKCATHLAEI